MNEVEQLALSLRRRAFEVMDGKESLTSFLDALWQLDSQTPDLLDKVADQMKQDNGRWSSTSALPDVDVWRDKSGRIGLISFFNPEDLGDTVGSKNKPLVWCANREGSID